MHRWLGFSVLLIGLWLTGCGGGFGERARYGITFYCPGAGNVDMGDAGIRAGLERAGYRGQVLRLTWSISFNPAIDQTVRAIARLGAKRLAGYIQDYRNEYPDQEINVIGLSAGTGVAVWALEDLRSGYSVDNVVLLASSLSSDYDVSEALRHVRGNIYNYYSPNDAVLAGPMKVFGTIDGKLMADGAGSVGLHPPGRSSRVVNIRWRPEFARYGYNGGHLDSTTPSFVRHHVARHIVTPRSAGLHDTPAAWELLTALREDTPVEEAVESVEPAEVRLVSVAADEEPTTDMYAGLSPAARERLETVMAATERPLSRWDTSEAPRGEYIAVADAEDEEGVSAERRVVSTAVTLSVGDTAALDRLMRVMRGDAVEPVVTENGALPSQVAEARRLLRVLEGKEYREPAIRYGLARLRGTGRATSGATTLPDARQD